MATAITTIETNYWNGNQGTISPETFSWIFYVLPFVILLAAMPQLLWMWSVATKLRAFIRSSDKLPRLMLFKVAFVVFTLIVAYLPIHFFNFFVGVFKQGDSVNPMTIIGFVLGVIGIQAIMLFCFLNMTYTVTKTLKMAEEQREVKFSDFAGDFFFLLFMFPIAIWFIQPRINKVILIDPAEDLSLSNEKTLDL